MRNIVKYTKIYSGGMPEFKEDDIFRTIIPLKKTEVKEKDWTENWTENRTENINLTQKRILELISKKPYITQKELIKEMNLGRTAITLNIKYLKDNKFIEREGSDRKGYWKIIKNKS